MQILPPIYCIIFKDKNQKDAQGVSCRGMQLNVKVTCGLKRPQKRRVKCRNGKNREPGKDNACLARLLPAWQFAACTERFGICRSASVVALLSTGISRDDM